MMGPDDAIPDTSFAASLQELINHKIKQKHEVAAIDSPVEKGTVPYGPVRPSLFHVGRPSSLFRHCPSSDTVPRPCSVLRAERIVGCNPLLPQLSVTQL